MLLDKKMVSENTQNYASQPIMSRAKDIPTGYDLCNLVLLTGSLSLLPLSWLFPFTPFGTAVMLVSLVSAMNCSP